MRAKLNAIPLENGNPEDCPWPKLSAKLATSVQPTLSVGLHESGARPFGQIRDPSPVWTNFRPTGVGFILNNKKRLLLVLYITRSFAHSFEYMSTFLSGESNFSAIKTSCGKQLSKEAFCQLVQVPFSVIVNFVMNVLVRRRCCFPCNN